MIGFSELLAKSIKEKEVFIFSSDQIKTPVRHLFICVKRNEDETLILSCCTSRPESSRKFIADRGLPAETLVHIPPKTVDPNSPFDVDTYVNCNDYIPHTVAQLVAKFQSGDLEVVNSLPDRYYDQILAGFHISPQIDEETKEILPKPANPADDGKS